MTLQPSAVRQGSFTTTGTLAASPSAALLRNLKLRRVIVAAAHSRRERERLRRLRDAPRRREITDWHFVALLLQHDAALALSAACSCVTAC